MKAGDKTCGSLERRSSINQMLLFVLTIHNWRIVVGRRSEAISFPYFPSPDTLPHIGGLYRSSCIPSPLTDWVFSIEPLEDSVF